MYKLLNKLFGWDYIQWNNGLYCGISKVHVDGLNRPYFFMYRSQKVIKIITFSDQVIWLTCHPDKYLKVVQFTSAAK